MGVAALRRERATRMCDSRWLGSDGETALAFAVGDSTKRSRADGAIFVRACHNARLADLPNESYEERQFIQKSSEISLSCAAPLGQHGIWPANSFVMRGDESMVSAGFLRRALAKLMSAASRKLHSVSRHLGAPALTTIPVSAAMLTALPVIKPEQPLADVAQLFLGGRNHELAVVDDGHPVGVVTRDDVAAGLEQCGPRASVAETPQHDVLTVTPSDSLVDVFDQLRASPHAVAVVVDHGEPVGLLTFEKLAAYLRNAG